MIEIITTDGISLDLSPDAEFEIEIENPMLDDSHIPVPFSTAISFLPTRTNKKVFGYLGAMMMEPAVTKLKATVFSCGIPLMNGTLIYDGIEDNNLNYTFSAKNMAQEFSGYIHEVAPIPAINESYGQNIFGPLFDNIADGSLEKGFAIPMLINSAEVAKEDEALLKATGKDGGVPYDIKYRNYHWNVYASISPAVLISSILSNLDIRIGDIGTSLVFNSIGILGLHRTIGWPTGFGPSTKSVTTLDVKNLLPECTVEELISNVLKIICGSIFLDGDSYVLFGNSGLLQSDDIYCWDDKISDIYSLSSEDGMHYDFGYKETTTGNENYDKKADIIKVDNHYSLISKTSGQEEYVAIKRTDTGCIYSGKTDKYSISETENVNIPYFDVIFRDDNLSPRQEDNGRNTYNARSDFKLVKCIPARVSYYDEYTEEYTYRDASCPVLEFPKLDGSRTKDIYVGIVSRNQFTDSGRVLTPDSKSPYGVETYSGISLLPNEIFHKCHKVFADWISKDKQLISAEFNLSQAEISKFRIWKKVLIKNRFFIIKKATITLRSQSDIISFRCDLLSL